MRFWESYEIVNLAFSFFLLYLIFLAVMYNGLMTFSLNTILGLYYIILFITGVGQ